MKSNRIFFDLDLNWINNINVNLSAVERRTTTLVKRRSVKKEYQASWLLKAITLIAVSYTHLTLPTNREV